VRVGEGNEPIAGRGVIVGIGVSGGNPCVGTGSAVTVFVAMTAIVLVAVGIGVLGGRMPCVAAIITVGVAFKAGNGVMVGIGVSGGKPPRVTIEVATAFRF
jgi:hypothetical protein